MIIIIMTKKSQGALESCILPINIDNSQAPLAFREEELSNNNSYNNGIVLQKTAKKIKLFKMHLTCRFTHKNFCLITLQMYLPPLLA